MSASSKKKLRKAQETEKLTEKQLTEQKEAKKLKLYTTIFVVVLAVMVAAAVWVAVRSAINAIENNGSKERNTIAMTVGDHEISNAELNYFFIDAVNNFYSNYGSYAALFGLDVSLPLNEQVTDEETGATWADDFLDSAMENARAVYALADEAKAQGYTLSEEEQASIDSQVSMASFYASYYGFSDVEDYLKALYGNGANEENFRAYAELTTLASSYQTHYANSLTYDDAALREAEAENYAAYSSFNYNSYYLTTSKFLPEGTTEATDEEQEAAELAVEAAAKALAEGEYASVADFDAAIAALEINGEATGASSTAYEDTAYSSINSTIQEWVTDSSRVAGDVTYIASTSHTHAEGETHSDDEDASEHETVNGYYVVYFNGSSDNNFALANVRHILVAFEGGTTDDNGNTTYSDDEKAAAKTAAEEILAQWEAGEATEDTFAALANEQSDDGDGTTGGLYEDVYPGQMVTNFNDWCFDESRKAGDTGIVETEYGYHVMFYSGDSETTYRDYQITNELKSADTDAWYNALVEALTVTELDTSYIAKDLVLSSESES